MENLKNSVELEFINSTGAIFNDYFIIHNFRNLNGFPLSTIRKVKLHRTRQIRWNVLALLSLALVLFLAFRMNIDQMVKYTLLAVSSLLFFLGFRFRNYEYKLIVFSETDFFEIALDNCLKDDAKAFMTKVNRKIKQIN